MLIPFNLCGTYFPTLFIFPIACKRLRTVDLSTWSLFANLLVYWRGSSSSSTSNSSVSNCWGATGHSLSSKLKSSTQNRANQIWQVFALTELSSSIEEQLEAKIIRKSNSQYRSPVILVKKTRSKHSNHDRLPVVKQYQLKKLISTSQHRRNTLKIQQSQDIHKDWLIQWVLPN